MENDENLPFEASIAEDALRQGEVLSDVFEVVADTILGDVEHQSIRIITHPFAIILSQNCDLDRDWNEQKSGPKLTYGRLRNILFCEVSTAEEVRNDGKKEGSSMPKITSSIWRQICSNRDERFHFLERVTTSDDLLAHGLPELVVHFRRIFVIETDRLYAQIHAGETTRRCRLRSPYLEHLSHRFAGYWSRVALPKPHRSE